MAAGLGFKDFVTGEVLTAADVDGYLMQGIWVFANATARDAAVTSPQEGNSCYLKDTDVIQVYSGSSWVVKSGGSSPLTTKGDLYTYSTTDTRLASSGVNNDVLTVDTSTATGLKWAAPSSGGMTLISTTTLTGSSVTLSTIPSGYNSLELRILNFLPATDAAECRMRINGDSNTRYSFGVAANATDETFVALNYIQISAANDNSVASGLNIITIPDYTSTNRFKTGEAVGVNVNQTTTANFNTNFTRFYYNQLAAITSLDIFPSSGNFTSGTALLYGVK
jgi:hypothetical protein